MQLSDLDTPTIVADLGVLEMNIRSMAEHCQKIGIPLRSHTKTHKIPEIARMQIAAGAIGICCQKLGEAEVMVAGGLNNILIPYNIVGTSKLERLTALSRRANITVSLDSEAVAKGISEQAVKEDTDVNVIIELDTNHFRCGVQTPDAAERLAKIVTRLKRLQLQGFMFYPSEERARKFVEATVAKMQKNSVPLNIVSGGGTGREAESKSLGCTETRSGSYAFEGLKRTGAKTLPGADSCVIRIISTVVSTPTPGRVIIDAGWKTFTSHVRDPRVPMGVLAEYPEARVYDLSMEHGHVDVRKCKHAFRVGERVSVIPMHQEMSLNLHDELIGYKRDRVEVIWKVQGRGKVR